MKVLVANEGPWGSLRAEFISGLSQCFGTAASFFAFGEESLPDDTAIHPTFIPRPTELSRGWQAGELKYLDLRPPEWVIAQVFIPAAELAAAAAGREFDYICLPADVQCAAFLLPALAAFKVKWRLVVLFLDRPALSHVTGDSGDAVALQLQDWALRSADYRLAAAQEWREAWSQQSAYPVKAASEFKPGWWRGRGALADEIFKAECRSNYKVLAGQIGWPELLPAQQEINERVSREQTALRQQEAAAGGRQHFWDLYQHCWQLPERTQQQLTDKVSQLCQLSGALKWDRVRIWQELGRLELLRGNSNEALAYKLRVLRALGKDRFGEVAGISRLLEQNGFNHEAEVVQVMYGSGRSGFKKALAYLDRRYRDLQKSPKADFELIDDRRPVGAFKASILVSLYQAGGKLELFLRELGRQTLIGQNALELILLDSGSPAGEYEIFQRFFSDHSWPVVYARTAQRETIQQAWNRALTLCRGEYLSFLGVDELIVPEALVVLCAELDRSAEIDWVVGGAMVSEVAADGRPIRDIVFYDRSGYEHELVPLCTEYLSWVGGLCRRSVHERFGYFDPSFRAAGDTEFKARVQPHIKSRGISRILGHFLNYPEQRASVGAHTEVEDLRAWYLFRSAAGAAYCYRRRPAAELEHILKRSLAYRKCYFRHISTDFDYAESLMTELARQGQRSSWLELQPGLAGLLASYRRMEYLDPLTPQAGQAALPELQEQAARLEQQLRSRLSLPPEPIFKLFNDNRYEQHTWPWLVNTKAV